MTFIFIFAINTTCLTPVFSVWRLLIQESDESIPKPYKPREYTYAQSNIASFASSCLLIFASQISSVYTGPIIWLDGMVVLTGLMMIVNKDYSAYIKSIKKQNIFWKNNHLVFLLLYIVILLLLRNCGKDVETCQIIGMMYLRTLCF